MSWANSPEYILSADVAAAGTFVVPYPTGTSFNDYDVDSPQHILGVGPKRGSRTYYKNSDGFTVAFAAAGVTVTWKGTTTLKQGWSAALQLDRMGANDDPTQQLILPNNVFRDLLVRVNLGRPIASVDNNIRANAAQAAGGALTNLLLGALDVPRNVIITSSADDTARTFTVTGKDVYGNVMVEAITGANGIANGKKAFASITTITIDAAAAANVKVGVGNVLGLPIWLPTTAGTIVKEIQDGASATAGTTVAGLARATKSTSTTADVRGTYVPNSAPDATKHYSLVLQLDDPTYTGNPQFAG